MTGVSAAVQRFQTILRKVDGTPFRGTILPADEGVTGALLSAKLILRTMPGAPVAPRDIIFDLSGQRYLVAKLGIRPAYKTFRLFEINADLRLKRTTKIRDPLTGLARSEKATDLGLFPAMLERSGADRVDGAMRVAEETRSVVTGEQLQLGDIVDDGVVRWVTEILGVTHGEIR